MGEANSYHTQGLLSCPDGFTVLASSEDGEIEAIRHQTLLWEGWMWHPERSQDFAARDIERLRALFT
jgi:putative glutamine amidotransferase